MSHWTYDAGQLNDTTAGYYAGSTVGERYQVRMLLQDTNSSRQLFQDEEIDWQVAHEANIYMATAMFADILVTRAGGVKSKKISEFSITYDVDFYRTLAVSMRGRGVGHQVPYCGGISKSDKLSQQVDPDWVTPTFSRNLDDNPAAPKPTNPPINPLTHN